MTTPCQLDQEDRQLLSDSNHISGTQPCHGMETHRRLHRELCYLGPHVSKAGPLQHCGFTVRHQGHLKEEGGSFGFKSVTSIHV